jgi:endonuclease/exonuclease/phosphatase family metal-dependent hydrolase
MNKKISHLLLYGFQIMTFNTGLAPSYVPFSTERTPVIAATLANQSSDVLCLQEVWQKSDQDLLIQKLSTKFPYHFSFQTEPVKTPTAPSCRIKNLLGSGKFINCLTSNCLLKPTNGLTHCILEQCKPALENLKKENPYCAQALMAQVKYLPPRAFWNILNPIKPADLFTYESNTGVMIFSKYPFLKTEVIDLTANSTLNRRAVLKVDILPKDFSKSVSVYCTHLTANFTTSLPYSGKYKSWEEENKFQVIEVIKHIKNNPQPSLLAGDFNCSQENKSAGIDEDWSQNCELLRTELEEVKLQFPACSFCKANPLTMSEPQNLLLDHIYVNGLDYLPAEIRLNGPYPINFGDKGFELKPLSDHYAVETFVTDVKPTLQIRTSSNIQSKKNKKLF